MNTDNIHNIESNNHLVDKKLFGLWIYLMSDCILFATMFAVYYVMSKNIIIYSIFFNLKFIFFETFLLLFSSVTYGITVLCFKYNKILFVYIFMIITFFLGLCFVIMELYEFHHLIRLGLSPQKDGSLSAFFTLIGLHGMHVIIGLLWMIGLFFQIIKCNLKYLIYVRILSLGLFWHFLDIIWIFVFTIVYLLGSI
ncbi:cytochrome c oxidase subunit 3 [Buchnera aphidicola]|uniref:Cytochrome bo(3) ubiquinol oxidase subunit 3 n=1 Tax=Buchnera aphidicola (Stegophylla sp.) TaxID=2315800 RepID=A0A4D6Y8Z1_9GAMM|nr:cytochrome c oxidase subunit 3 [Buchnera aphidicola (Stegophylla sp.)]QCI26446.1 cytochrome o ubiquinol oxidase subunit III [Buchnera aphidicola (Stegophylla sp.)]